MFMENHGFNILNYHRFSTSEVKIGDVALGGNHPIVVQSMTTSDTMNTEAVVDEIIRIFKAGGKIVRLTTPSVKEATHLAIIKKELNRKGVYVPLVADVHFTPNAALIAAGIVEKVRINPGNFAEKRDDTTNEKAQENIRQKLLPLIHICKKNNVAMRIGTNHGSLSERMMNKYGDTPKGMVESAMEYIRICAQEDFHNLVISMKSSNPMVMIQAYRLLVSTMHNEGFAYPLHLGVTEAGDGEDGRIKSALGIGTLLEDGIGDTIRVSLTEPAEHEIPVGKTILKRFENRINTSYSLYAPFYNPFEYTKRTTHNSLGIGGKNYPVIIHDFSARDKISIASLYPVGYKYDDQNDKWLTQERAADFLYIGNINLDFEPPGNIGILQNLETWLTCGANKSNHYPLCTISELTNFVVETKFFVKIDEQNINDFLKINDTIIYRNSILIYEPNEDTPVYSSRYLFQKLAEHNLKNPVIICSSTKTQEPDDYRINTTIDIGSILIDGMGDGMFVQRNNISLNELNNTAFGILQATRTRVSKTEYISCPSCGRTLFDLQETTAKIKASTQHLKGLKIGIMGCIVNGPGEMADADYGYVGSGPGKINLYKSKEVIKRNIPHNEAVDELIKIIKENGDWIENEQKS
jgi:(E)-4-hydroxy-3-methylbut-2-enyl-diphosphate synthase